MSWRHHAVRTETERAAFTAAVAFLEGRLEDRATIEWAVGLPATKLPSRAAVLWLLDMPAGRQIGEPWRSAWRLIEEYWDAPPQPHAHSLRHGIHERLAAGDRSGSLVRLIASLVAGQLKIELIRERDAPESRQRRARTIQDLFYPGLTSPELIDPRALGFDLVTEPPFLKAVVRALETSIADSFDLGRRIGWDSRSGLWRLGEVRRVYFVDTGDDQNEPDEFGRGLAPAVKTLHAAMVRLKAIDLAGAVRIMQGWKASGTLIDQRLWATLARDPLVAPATEVADLLAALDRERFWDVHGAPEIAELRAFRFAEMDDAAQQTIVARIVSGPPRAKWRRRESDPERITSAQRYWSVRELRRIEVAGGALPPRAQRWLADRIGEFPELAGPMSTQEGFLDGIQVYGGHREPDGRYDLLEGEPRLSLLEESLASARVHWDDDPSQRAQDWIAAGENTLGVIADLEAAEAAGAAYPLVWDRLGWSHSPNQVDPANPTPPEELARRTHRVLELLAVLPADTITRSISGIAHWLSVWGRTGAVDPLLLDVWRKIWPIAVEATNAVQAEDEDTDLNIIARGNRDDEPRDLDTLNCPAGKLIGVFFYVWSKTPEGTAPFAEGSSARVMRDIIIAAEGRTALVARHRFLSNLAYFQNADPAWSEANLTPPLLADTADAVVLWRAVARHWLRHETIRELADPILQRIGDGRLGRETRKSLVFMVVVDCLRSYRRERPPAISHARIQQMLRSLDDELRASAAEAIQRFVRDQSKEPEFETDTREGLYRRVGRPFLRDVWPQERSLATPGVSKALADLPGAAGDAFAEVVTDIERFLVPFQCWTLYDYGLRDGEEDLAIIDAPAKATALLTLLDLTIGTAEDATIPHGLGAALNRIREVSPALGTHPAFRRLSAAARH